MDKLKFHILFSLLLSSAGVAADPPIPPGAPTPPDAPIDGYLELVVIIGLIFGAYMIYRYNQKQKNPV